MNTDDTSSTESEILMNIDDIMVIEDYPLEQVVGSYQCPLSPKICYSPKDVGSSHIDRYTIVLDLDETLINARNDCLIIRPFAKTLIKIIERMGQEVIVWSAGLDKHVCYSLDRLNNNYENISYIVCRGEWYEKEKVKKVSHLPRSLDKILLFDDTPQMCMENYGNAIWVPKFTGYLPDDCLAKIIEVLNDLIESKKPVPEFLKSCGSILEANKMYTIL